MRARFIAPTRRQFLKTAAAATLFTAIGGLARPFISREWATTIVPKSV
jgi:hypothetical protein